ncbi:MAG: hypothetical protein AAB540_03280 [Patescibacteria group bacterium]
MRGIKIAIGQTMGETTKYWHAEGCAFSDISGREVFGNSALTLTAEGQEMSSGDPLPFMFSIRRNETPSITSEPKNKVS